MVHRIGMHFHFLLDQKVMQKIKSHRRRSGKIFSWTSCGKFRFALNDKRFPHAVLQSKFFFSSLPRCDRAGLGLRQVDQCSGNQLEVDFSPPDRFISIAIESPPTTRRSEKMQTSASLSLSKMLPCDTTRHRQ